MMNSESTKSPEGTGMHLKATYIFKLVVLHVQKGPFILIISDYVTVDFELGTTESKVCRLGEITSVKLLVFCGHHECIANTVKYPCLPITVTISVTSIGKREDSNASLKNQNRCQHKWAIESIKEISESYSQSERSQFAWEDWKERQQ